LIKVKAVTNGAISIVNAMALGKGSSLGIELKCEAYLELKEGKEEFILETEEDKSLVLEVIKRGLKIMNCKGYSIYLKISSEIPVAKGLKSSSAVANAVALALYGALKENFDDFEVINLGVDASIASGVTLTGAYDDACASYFGGLVITDNYNRKLIRRENLKDELNVVILVPERKRYTKSINREEIKKFSFLVEEAFNLSLKGEYFKAMIFNGLIYSMIFQEPTEAVYEALKLGALGVSLSGKGPALAVVCTADKVKEILETFSKFGEKIIVTKVNNRRAELIRR